MTTISIPYFDLQACRSLDIVQSGNAHAAGNPLHGKGDDPFQERWKKSGNPDHQQTCAALAGNGQSASIAAESASENAIEKLTTVILSRFPLASPAIVLFTGSEGNPHSHSTCSAVAQSLARKSIGNVLIIDSSLGCELTAMHDQNGQRGLSNLLAHTFDWQSCVLGLPQSGLFFLGAGTTHWEHWGAEQRLRELAAEMKRVFQYICVSVGDAQHLNSKIWSSVCDGSFLLVSLKNANPRITESAVAELQSYGARLLGCVVTETDSSL